MRSATCPIRASRVTTSSARARCTSVYAQYTVEVADRAKVEPADEGRGIPTAVHYPVPLHLQPVFANLKQARARFRCRKPRGSRD